MGFATPPPGIDKIALTALFVATASAMANIATTLLMPVLERRLSNERRLLLAAAWLLAVCAITASVAYEQFAVAGVFLLSSSTMPFWLSQKAIVIPNDPHVVPGSVELAYWETEEMWAFTVDCIISPMFGHGILLDGAKSYAHILAPQADPDHEPLTISLLNIRKNEGPPLAQARIDDAAGVLLLCRHNAARWNYPVPERLLARIMLYDEARKTGYTMQIILVRVGKEEWKGHGEALDMETKEFVGHEPRPVVLPTN